jgi:hypothetical protein
MKQERLLPGLRYQGVPTRVMGRERAEPQTGARIRRRTRTLA